MNENDIIYYVSEMPYISPPIIYKCKISRIYREWIEVEFLTEKPYVQNIRKNDPIYASLGEAKGYAKQYFIDKLSELRSKLMNDIAEIDKLYYDPESYIKIYG